MYPACGYRLEGAWESGVFLILIGLVITLLSSGGVLDEVLTLVRPVCKVKVRENSVL
jgi:hypothetical protein